MLVHIKWGMILFMIRSVLVVREVKGYIQEVEDLEIPIKRSGRLTAAEFLARNIREVSDPAEKMAARKKKKKKKKSNRVVFQDMGAGWVECS